MIKQSSIFNFNAKLNNETESDTEKFNTCIDIFKVLNLIYPIDEDNKENKYKTYFSYFKEQEVEYKKRRA